MVKSKSPIKYAIVNAFADSVFRGNPAAVCLLAEEKEESWLQLVARELNTPATAFLNLISQPDSDPSSIPRFKLRWFTPVSQVKICGHATLATSHLVFTSGLVNGNTIEYSTLSGILTAKKVSEFESAFTVNSQNLDVAEEQQQSLIELDLPLIPLIDYNSDEILLISEALSGASVVDIKRTTTEDDLLVVLDSAALVVNLQPNLEKIRSCHARGMIVTSLAPPDSKFDFISRFFFPKIGLNEDAVCGSAHCALANYWSKRLGKRDFLAYAASARGGVVRLHLDESNNRVRLQGSAITMTELKVLLF